MELGFLGLQEKLKVKRKRVKKSKTLNKKKLLENGAGVELQLQQVNCRGKVVDFAELENTGDELYNEELKRRTVGLETEDGVLGFLWGLEGQWCSRRRKRKYVDAGMFGDALPIGWKLLLGLRRRDFRVSVYCRRFVSPSGEQFISCKEAAAFLKSYFGGGAADEHTDQKTGSIQQAYDISREKSSRPAEKADDTVHDGSSHLASVKSSSVAQNDCVKGIESLPEVQVQDIFECAKCNLTFDERNAYLQHLLSVHQKASKRCRSGATVGEGVIIKDGKYECQFCHKVFLERRSYNGHVGIHVRNSGKNSIELSTPANFEGNSESPVEEEMPSRSSKMDALIEIAQSSIFQTSTVDTGEHPTASQSTGVLSLEEAQAASNGDEVDVFPEPVELQKVDSTAELALGETLNHGTEVLIVDSDMAGNDCEWDANVKMETSSINDPEPAEAVDTDKYAEGSLNMDCYEDNCLKLTDSRQEETPGVAVGLDVFVDGVPSVPSPQSYQFFPPFDSVSNKGENEFTVADQKLESVTDFEELSFEDMEPYQYGFVPEQVLPSLPDGSMNLRDDNAIDDGFNTSVGFGSDEVMLDDNELTVCVWCRTEFKLEGIDLESASDSIGYMCPTCKSNISGHFNQDL